MQSMFKCKNLLDSGFAWPQEVLKLHGSFLSCLELGQKQKNYRCKIQFSFHLPLKLPCQNICQRGYITSSTAPVFGLRHDMGHFCPFCSRIYTTYTSFPLLKKYPKSHNYYVMYQTLCSVCREVVYQGNKWRLLSHLNQGRESTR